MPKVGGYFREDEQKLVSYNVHHHTLRRKLAHRRSPRAEIAAHNLKDAPKKKSKLEKRPKKKKNTSYIGC